MDAFNWNDLQTFLAIARTGRLTVAAQRLNLDHSTLSRRLASLEEALGVKLFDRRATGYTLTQEGEALIQEAESIESISLRLQTRLQDAQHSVSGTVRIGTPEGFGTWFLAERLPRLMADHPQLEVELVANPRNFSLSKREADLSIAMARPDHGRVHARKLVDYELGIYGAPSYLARHDAIDSVAQLTQHKWVGYVEDLMWTPELNYFRGQIPVIHPGIRISNVISQLAAVRAGVGLGVLPCFMARGEAGLRQILPSQKINRTYWIITHADTCELARVKVMQQFLEREVAREPLFWRI
ncbi:LysR family transcriptional regulator [Pseudomonas sp. NPDC088368]|jgi:DNA-binding transcriptional LysR family regulator|uniref:LysR family transcriptional regulator n=1 Tax=Pseudomonas sp. NPDC088368 TaxID=3364453 RepID=UPI003800322F